MDKKVYELLNDQINKELYSAYLYMDFANYYEEEGLTGFANSGSGRARSCAEVPQLLA